MSATVIDTLVLELGLDPAKFTQGQKDALEAFKRTGEASTKVGNEIESQGKKSDALFATLKRNAIGLAAVFLSGYGIKEFTGYLAGLDAMTGRLSKTMNMSAKELSAWQGAFEQNGGSAESASAALQGLSGDMNKFMLTGQSTMLPILNSMGLGLFNANKQMKTAGELMLDISDRVSGMDPARAAALLSMIPGMNQDSINLLIQGRSAVQAYLDAAKQAGGTTEQSAAAARKYQQDLSLLERTATNLGRTIVSVTGIFSGLSNVMSGLASGIKELTFLPEILEDVARNITSMLPDWAIKLLFGSKTLADVRSKPSGYSAYTNARVGEARKELAEKMSGGRSGAPAGSAAEQEAYIRASAAARGIDPDIAVRVAKSEGLGGAYSGDRGSSFGPFQLHYGSMAGGGMTVGGLGDTFTKKTGLHAKDPSTWKAQVDFALDEAKKSGWGAWHGWKGVPNAGLGGVPQGEGGGRSGNQTSTTVQNNIGKIEVHSSAANPGDVASEIPAALKRANWAASANNGQQ